MRAYGGFCLQPERPARCDVADNTRLVYYKADKCDEKFMYFTHKDGVLTHSCSGKRVCPRGENRESILRLKETLTYSFVNVDFFTRFQMPYLSQVER